MLQRNRAAEGDSRPAEPFPRPGASNLAGDRAAVGDKPACADAGSKVPNPRRISRHRAAFFDPVAIAQMHAFSGMRRLSSRQTSDEALEPKPVNPEVESKFSPAAKRTPCDPLFLPGSRISETRETTGGSAELKFRIHSPPAKSLQTFGSYPRCAGLSADMLIANAGHFC